jgi:RNA polymerase sigma factor (sigma-70 family)
LTSSEPEAFKKDAPPARAGTQWLQGPISLFKPPAQADGRPTLLSELALSVACEQREDWQPGAALPLSLEDANFAFDSLYSRHKAKVAGTIRQRFPLLKAEDIADTAWSGMFLTYWSNDARRRFLGLACISTVVISTAVHIAVNEVRDGNAIAGGVEPNAGDENGPPYSVPEDLVDKCDPEKKLLAKELYDRIKACMRLLTPRQHIVAEMIWFRKLKQRCVARILDRSESNVSELLTLAEGKVLDCARSPMQV